LFQLKNASPQAVSKVLQDAFQKNRTTANRSTTTETDALELRGTTAANQQNNATASRAGTGRAGAGFSQGGLGGGGFGGGQAGP
jgi:uncharacterized membrane protein